MPIERQSIESLKHNDFDGNIICVDALPTNTETINKVYAFVCKAERLGFISEENFGLTTEIMFNDNDIKESSFITIDMFSGSSVKVVYNTELDFEFVWESNDFRSFDFQLDFILEKMENILSTLAVFGVSTTNEE